MATITFDTHKFIRKLESAGFSTQQAEAVADAFKEASGEADLATKRDIERLEAKLDRLEAKLTGEMDKRFERIAGELLLIKWMLGFILGGIVALILKSFFPI